MKVYLLASGKKPPLAPSSLTATAVSSSRIDLAWVDNSLDEDGFKIERSLDGVNFTEITTVGAGVTTYASTGLSGGTQYYYRVRAYKGSLNSAYSNLANATTQVAGVERIITIDTTKTVAGGSASNQFTLSVASGTNITVDWGDGVVQSGITTSTTKTYAVAGLYDIKITGAIRHSPNALASDDKQKYIEIKQWGAGVTGSNFSGAFQGCVNMTVTAGDAPSLSGTARTDGMFRNCALLTNPDFSNWNTSSVTNMSGMFENCTNFNGNIGSWNVSNVTTFESMFKACRQFNQDISGWNTGSCTNFSGMFSATGSSISLRTNFNQPIGSWNTSSATNMASMFFNCVFNQPLNLWNVSSVATMNSMFMSSQFNQNIGSWNVSSVADFSSMFRQSTVFNNGGSSDINNWTIKTTGSVNMSNMFQISTAFNQPIGSWDTSAVTNIGSMFNGATLFNQPLNTWNTSNVTNMASTFQNAIAFNQPLDSWDVGRVNSFSSMFNNSGFNNNTSIGNWNFGQNLTLSSTFSISSFFGSTFFTTPNISAWDMIRCNSLTSAFSFGGNGSDISSWDIRNVTNSNNFMSGLTNSTMSAVTLANIYIAWASRPQNAQPISFGTAKYDASGASARAILTAPRAVSVSGATDPNANGTYTHNGTRYQNANGWFFFIAQAGVTMQWILRDNLSVDRATATGTFPTANNFSPATVSGWTGSQSGIVVTMTGAGWTLTDGGQL